MSLFFRAAYRFGFRPWDSGIPPPELVEFVECERHPPGMALDLGCGTGTICVYLAEHGLDATGIDFVPRAIEMAQTKAAATRATATFIVSDVTHLTELNIGTGYKLLFDQGCFHSIPDEARDAYVRGVTAVAHPGATMLLFCLVRGDKPRRLGPRGVERGEVARRFAPHWTMMGDQTGRPMFGYDTAWYRLRKR